MALALGVRAQQPLAPAKTQISDVLYRADGNPATGALVISWPAFETADKKAVAAGTLTALLGNDGSVSLELAPNFGATPAGSHYTVVLRLDDGTSSTEYWTVPVVSPTTIGAIRSTLLPSETAMQVVSKTYLDSQVSGLAVDGQVVHLNGDESIAGVKTFVNDVVVGATVLDATGGVVAPASSNFVWEGDSITAGQGLATGQDWASRAMLGSWFAGRGTKTNLAASGSQTQDVLNRYAAVHALSPAVTANVGYFFLMVGLNDLAHTTDSGLVIYGRLQSLWSKAQADGYKVVAATVTGMQGLTADRELQRQALNLSIRTSSSWNYLLDFDAVLPDPSDTTLYQDGMHPTASGAVLLGRTAANLMPSSTVSSQNAVPAYDHTVQGWSSIGKWLTVGMTGATDTLRVFPQNSGQGVQVVATDAGSTSYRPLTMVGSSVQYSHDGGGGDVLALYPGGPGVGSTLSSATSNMAQYTPLAMNASEFRFGKGLDMLHFYPGTSGTGVAISSAKADLSAFSPLPIKASNWSVDSSGNIATTGNVAVGTTIHVSCLNTAADLTTIRNAITALTPQGGTIVLPQTPCYLNVQTGTEALLLTARINFSGGELDFNVAPGMNWMRVSPATGTNYGAQSYMFNWAIKDTVLAGVTAPGTYAATGANALVLDCSNNALGKILLDNATIKPVSTGYSVWMSNTTDLNGCIFTSDFTHNSFYNGIYLYGSGDTIAITNNQITNPLGDGVNLYSISGAANNKILHNTTITKGVPIHIRAASHLTVENNELGIHNYGSSTFAAASLWLDGAQPYAINDVLIKNNFIGIDQGGSGGAIASPNLQIDSGVRDVHIEVNQWNPMVNSGVPTPAVINNGSQTCLEPNQKISMGNYYPNWVFWSGNGSTCDSTFTSQQFGGLLENRLLWSEDLTNPVWAVSTTGSGTVSTSTVSGITLPDGTVGSATRVRFSAPSGSDSAYLIQALSGLANPHPSVEQVFIRNTTCPGSTVYELNLGGLASAGAINSDCAGDHNGWRKAVIGQPAVEASTSDRLLVGIYGGSIYSSTADVLIWGAQHSANASRYVKTTDSAVPLSYGVSPRLSAGAQSPMGFQDISTAVRPTCNVAHRGQMYIEKGTGTNGLDQPLVCNQLTSSPASYGWQKLFSEAQQSENYLLQSNSWTTTPWVRDHSGAGLAPTVSASSATDPFGNTGTVQEVVFSLNGGATSGDESYVHQAITGLPNPHNSPESVWVKAASGTPTLFFANGASGAAVVNCPPIYATSTWQKVSCLDSVAGTSDVWEMGLIGGSIFSGTADVLVYGAQMAYNNGAYVQTTTTAIDNTALVPMGSGYTLGANKVTSLDGTGTVGVTANAGVISETAADTTARHGTLACDGIVNMTGSATTPFCLFYLDSAITVSRISVSSNTGASLSGCSTQPVISLVDVTDATTTASITLTSGARYWTTNSGSLPATLQTGKWYGWTLSTVQVGCSAGTSAVVIKAIY